MIKDVLFNEHKNLNVVKDYFARATTIPKYNLDKLVSEDVDRIRESASTEGILKLRGELFKKPTMVGKLFGVYTTNGFWGNFFSYHSHDEKTFTEQESYNLFSKLGMCSSREECGNLINYLDGLRVVINKDGGNDILKFNKTIGKNQNLRIDHEMGYVMGW